MAKQKNKIINKNEACYQAIAQWYLKHPDGDDLPISTFAKENNFNKATVSLQKKKYLATITEKTQSVIVYEANKEEDSIPKKTIKELLADLNIGMDDEIACDQDLYNKLRAKNIVYAQLLKANLVTIALKFATEKDIDKMPETVKFLIPLVIRAEP